MQAMKLLGGDRRGIEVRVQALSLGAIGRLDRLRVGILGDAERDVVALRVAREISHGSTTARAATRGDPSPVDGLRP